MARRCIPVGRPPHSIWSPWVKPALFAQLGAPPVLTPDDGGWQTLNVDWAPHPSARTALIIDLPREAPILMGLALAQRGYQPVVLMNSTKGPNPVIDLDRCLVALSCGESALRRHILPHNAPPAFLLDSRRRAGDRPAVPGLFDNRWIVLPQDFPSASFMLTSGIRDAAVVQMASGQPMDDLRHVLLRWQNAGLNISTGLVGQPPAPIEISRPSSFGYAWYTLLALVGLRPNSAGGFGSVVPIPSEGGRGWA